MNKINVSKIVRAIAHFKRGMRVRIGGIPVVVEFGMSKLGILIPKTLAHRTP